MNVRLALRYLGERKLRTALTTLAIVLGVALIFGLNSVLPAIRTAFRENLMAAAELTDLTVTSTSRGPFGEETVAIVAGAPGIAGATGTLTRPVILPLDLAPAGVGGRPVTSIMLVGIDPETYPRVRPLEVAAGRLFSGTDRERGEVLISTGLAESAGLRPGDTLVLPSAGGLARLEIAGLLDLPSLPGVEEVFVPLGAAQRLLNLPGLINNLEAMFAEGADSEAVRRAVLDRLGPAYRVGTVEAGSEFSAAMEMGSYAFLFFGVMALAMGSFVIFITFRTSVVERRRDIGMLRSLGASRRTVLSLVLTESLIQGVLGTALGIALGYAMGWGLVSAFSPFLARFVRFSMAAPTPDAGTYALAIGLGLGFTVLGALLPARAATRVTPLQAIAPPRAEAEIGGSRARVVAGIVLVALGIGGLLSGSLPLSALGAILFVTALLVTGPVLVSPISRIFGSLLGAIFAREGRVAESNLARQPGRAAVTVSALMVGLAVLVGMAGTMTSMMGGMTGYIDESLGESDYVIMPQSLLLGGGNVGASPELLAKIRSTPGVDAATGLRVATTVVEIGGSSVDIQFVGIEPTLYPRLAGLTFRGGGDEAYTALQAGRSVIVNALFASANGVEIGQDLTVVTLAGPRVYRVAGIGSDFINFKMATGYVSQAVLAEDFGETSDVLVFVGLDPGADRTPVTEALWDITRTYPAFTLFETTAWREEMMNQIDSLVLLFPILMLLLATPSLIALVNTLVINVLERTREMGVLRAVGATRRQVGRIILAESLLLAGAGTAFGVLAGVWLGRVMVGAIQAAAFDFPYSFPWAGILATIAVGMLFGVFAALVPARQAARLNVVRALQYE